MVKKRVISAWHVTDPRRSCSGQKPRFTQRKQRSRDAGIAPRVTPQVREPWPIQHQERGPEDAGASADKDGRGTMLFWRALPRWASDNRKPVMLTE